MNDKYFLDTNIFVYSFSPEQPAKRARSLDLIQASLQSGLGIISTQVIHEFINVATRKFSTPMKVDDCKVYLRMVLNPLCQVYPDLTLFETCLDIQQETGYSFYDSMIIAAALQSDCKVIYTEDLQDHQVIRNLSIRNPYR